MSADSRFSEARAAVLSEMRSTGGIGTLSEKLLHKILKFYIEPDVSFHEIEFKKSIADVKNREGIAEIQTRAFERLVPKLERFLPDVQVLAVLPLVDTKYIIKIDRESGEFIGRRKSPSHACINRAACELYKIARFIGHPNFRVKIIFLNFDEYRYESADGKRRSRSQTLIECIPSEITSEIDLVCPEDYRIFIPKGLGERFLASEMQKIIGLDSRRTHNTLSLLLSLGLIRRVGKDGRAYIYEIVKGEKSPLCDR